ncbi:right-handed parallel beta-helix repeat-containing protein, partial [Pontiella sp.]|uniref:right-handed parallel beta-helix repeat-containing protein n=1 Tax=Pontiella sp. TaxID=2837462 RepID=UPI003566A18F
MKKYDISFWVAALALTFAPSSVLAHTVYVSPKGHDANRGTKAAPLSSVAAARDALRAGGKLGKEPCAVILEAGIYRLAEPLRFTPQDSGAEGAEVVYLAAEGADVTLTGALSLKLNWKPWKDGIYQAKLESEQTVDQLFINGTRQVMARYPNAGAGKAVPFDGYSADAWDHTVRGWKNPVGAFFHGMHKSRWGGTHYQVTGLQDGKLITEGGWMENRAGTPHKEYRMAENIFEELDAPGEWFYHLDKQTLYYVPENGTDLAAATAEAVFEVPHLIEIYGDTQLPMPTMKITTLGNGMKELIVETPVTTQPVQHIQFKGIHFTGTTRTFMQTKEPLLRSDWTIYRGGAVHLRGTEQITIAECRFDQLGGNAVFVDGYNRGTVIKGNRFEYNGASDVNFVGSPAAVRD